MKRPVPIELHARLGKLLPMLSSSNSGERSNAAAAIGRVLQSKGLDWHDLTACLLSPVPTPSPPPPPPPQSAPPTSMMMADDEARGLIKGIFDSGTHINDRSRAFLNSIAERADKYDVVYLSEKQLRWLMDLARAAHAKS